MKVDLVSWTPHALALILWTKHSRMGENISIETIQYKWSWEKKMEHLDYMFKTIQGPFEFVNYAFDVRGVSRATTHQMVRTRTASFQQESMRVVDARDHGWMSRTHVVCCPQRCTPGSWSMPTCGPFPRWLITGCVSEPRENSRTHLGLCAMKS